jgi:hypothetical protein
MLLVSVTGGKRKPEQQQHQQDGDKVGGPAARRGHHVLPALIMGVHGTKIVLDAAKSHSMSSLLHAGDLSRWARTPNARTAMPGRFGSEEVEWRYRP